MTCGPFVWKLVAVMLVANTVFWLEQAAEHTSVRHGIIVALIVLAAVLAGVWAAVFWHYCDERRNRRSGR